MFADQFCTNSDDQDLLWVGLDPPLKDYESEEHASDNPENTFLGLQPDSFASEDSEGFV